VIHRPRQLSVGVIKARLDQLVGKDLDAFSLDRALVNLGRDIIDGRWRDWDLPEDAPPLLGVESQDDCLLCRKPAVVAGLWTPRGRARKLVDGPTPWGLCRRCHLKPDVSIRVEAALMAKAERNRFAVRL
jgi:hypothetical protein